MALDTYDEIQTTILAWAARNDRASEVPDFIHLTELDLEEKLELELQRTPFSGTLASSGEIALPDGTIYVRRLSIDTDPPQDLKAISPDQLNNIRDASDRIPFAGYREGNAIRYAPISSAGAAYSGDAVVAVSPRLRDAGSMGSNTYLGKIPEAIVEGSLQRLFRRVRNFEAMSVHGAAYEAKIETIRRHQWRMRFSTGGPIRMQSDTYA